MMPGKPPLFLALVLLAGCKEPPPKEPAATAEAASPAPAPEPATADAAASRAAFLAAYPVFMHPRCVNCHPAGDAPLAGEDSRPHPQNVKRGPDGLGLYAMKCASCHQLKNLPGEGMPPGGAKWRLPPPETPMVFEGRTARELALQLKDKAQTGGKALADILEHVENDNLVLGGWDPADGRTKPPLSHEEFVARMREWVDKGAAAPE